MSRRPLLPVLATAALFAVGGCGGAGQEGASPPSAPAPSGQVADFPSAETADTLSELQGDLPKGPILQPAVSLLEKGTNRLAFAIFDLARTQLSGAEVVLYTAAPDGTGVRGPYAARSESLKVKSAFASRTTLDDPDAAKSVYVADVPFKRNGGVSVIALVRMDGRLMRTDAEVMRVGSKGATPPAPGEPAVAVDTDTLASAGGDERSIDTRTPPAPELHRINLRDVLGKKAVVLQFATPQLCQSRVCAPVVDIALQAKARAGSKVAFIHQEVFRDNKVQKGVRSQLADWKLATEPWTFVIDRQGIVRSRFEGPMSSGELERAVAAVR